MSRRLSLTALPLLALAVCTSAAAAPNCTAADILATFTPCNQATNQMYAVQYYGRTCTPTAAAELADPRPARCDEPCGSGTYLSAKEDRCVFCEPGYSSNSGGRIIRDFVGGIPKGFVTYCSPEPCQPWAPGPLGGMLTSGNQSAQPRAPSDSVTGWVDETVVSSLVTVVNVINPRGGAFFFSYRVESEQYFDGMQVFVNGTQYPPQTEKSYQTRFLLSGIHLSWRRMEIPLTKVGSTEIRIVFAKDRDQSSLQDESMAGADRAFVRDIVIEGVQMWAPECTPCAAGTIAASRGSIECDICPANTYSTLASHRCTPCGENQWSAPGSSACITMQPCTRDDYVATYGTCDKTKKTRMRTWQVSNNSRCLPKPEVKPADEQVMCAECMPGKQLNVLTGACDSCPDGYIRQDGTCTPCEAGYAAVPEVNFPTGFDSFGRSIDPGYFSMLCEGECRDCPRNSYDANCNASSSGFSLTSIPCTSTSGCDANDEDATVVAIQSNSGNGAEYLSTLRYRYFAVSAGHVSFQYFFTQPSNGRGNFEPSITVAVRVDDATAMELNLAATASSRVYFTAPIVTLGEHIIDIVVQQSVKPEFETLLTITNFRVSGDARGAAAHCRVCLPGTYCPEGAAAMTPCSPGFYTQNAGSLTCDLCDEGFFAPKPGSTQCSRCPAGTESSIHRAACVTTCEFELGPVRFDLTPLEHRRWSVPAPTWEPSAFYASVCGFTNRNSSDTICHSRNDVTLEPAYVCQQYGTDATRAYSLGDEPAFALNAAGSLTFGVSGGDNCNRGGMPRSTNITLLCDPAATTAGELTYVGEEPHCHYMFNLRSSAACPLCTEASFDRILGECSSNNFQELHYAKRPEAAQCSRGYTPPSSTNVSCEHCQPGDYEPYWSACLGGHQAIIFSLKIDRVACYDDGSARIAAAKDYAKDGRETNRTCSEMEVRMGANVFTVAAVIVIVIVVVLVIVLLLALREMRRMSVRYNSLAAANAAVGGGDELTEVDPYVQDAVQRSNQRAGLYDDDDVRGAARVAVPSDRANGAKKDPGTSDKKASLADD
jgi:hypothetical protein